MDVEDIAFVMVYGGLAAFLIVVVLRVRDLVKIRREMHASRERIVSPTAAGEEAEADLEKVQANWVQVEKDIRALSERQESEQ